MFESELVFFLSVTFILYFFFSYIFIKHLEFDYFLGFSIVFILMVSVNVTPLAKYDVELEVLCQLFLLCIIFFLFYKSDQDFKEEVNDLTSFENDFEAEFDVEEFGRSLQEHSAKLFNRKKIRNTFYRTLHEYNIFSFSKLKKKKKKSKKNN